MTRITNHYEVTNRLLGMIEPEGDTSIDEVRFQNLRDHIDLTSRLISDLILLSRHKNAQEFSVQKAGVEAQYFLDAFKKKLSEL